MLMLRDRWCRPFQTTKPGIFELDLHHGSVRETLPHFNALFHSSALADGLNGLFPGLQLVPGTQGHTVKLQINNGKRGCFPWHYDNPAKPNRRRLTCLLYLNRGWKQGEREKIWTGAPKTGGWALTAPWPPATLQATVESWCSSRSSGKRW